MKFASNLMRLLQLKDIVSPTIDLKVKLQYSNLKKIVTKRLI